MDKTTVKEVVLRVSAVIISLLLWIYVTTDQNPIIQAEITDIPVKLINVDSLSKTSFIMLGNIDGYTTKLVVKGIRKDVLALKPQDFKVEANLGNGYRVKGMNSIMVEITDYPRQLVDIPNQPIYISVELDELVKKNFPVVIQFDGKTKDGYTNLSPTVKPSEVILKGAAKFIGSVDHVAVRVKLSDIASNLQTSLPIEILDKNDKAVSGVESTPKTVDISVPVARIKDVPVNLRTTGKLPNGVFLRSTTLDIPQVTIIGDEKLINSISIIDTATINLDTVNSSITKQVKLIIPQGVSVVDNIQNINASINVESTIEKSYSVFVNYINLTSELKADLLTNTIIVTLSGQESAINKIIATDILAVIDLKNAPVDGGEFEYTPQLTTPPGFELKSVNPTKIKVKITKKQG